tara:strand:- start:1884 stop:2111 length:228 start_codon:yes stop_codon:yes gene_type:complete
MCIAPKMPSPPPAPEPIPAPVITKAVTTKQKAPLVAESGSNVGSSASNYNRKRLGRGSLRIPLASSGSGVNFPTS